MAKLLVTEDDISVRNFLEMAMQLDGHSVTLACDGAEALEILQERQQGNPFDLLLSDIQMPVMDGITLAMNTARDWPSLPILLMTGYAHQRERASGLDKLVQDVIMKPFSLAEIRDAVQKALA